MVKKPKNKFNELTTLTLVTPYIYIYTYIYIHYSSKDYIYH